jgi:hypothetical protein
MPFKEGASVHEARPSKAPLKIGGKTTYYCAAPSGSVRLYRPAEVGSVCTAALPAGPEQGIVRLTQEFGVGAFR